MKVLCVLYDDPKGGMPKTYPLSDIFKACFAFCSTIIIATLVFLTLIMC